VEEGGDDKVNLKGARTVLGVAGPLPHPLLPLLMLLPPSSVELVLARLDNRNDPVAADVRLSWSSCVLSEEISVSLSARAASTLPFSFCMPDLRIVKCRSIAANSS